MVSLHCQWCGKPKRFGRGRIKKGMKAFARWYKTGDHNENKTDFGVFCSWTCKQNFKKWLSIDDLP